MAVTSYWFANAFVNAFTQAKPLDWDTNTIKCLLTTSAWTPNQDTHASLTDITNEVTGTGYTTGGATLTTKTNATSLNVMTLDADDVAWASSTITARRAVLYDSTGGGTNGTRPLILWVDFGADVASTSATFTIVWNASGIATITPTDATGYP